MTLLCFTISAQVPPGVVDPSNVFLFLSFLGDKGTILVDAWISFSSVSADIVSKGGISLSSMCSAWNWSMVEAYFPSLGFSLLIFGSFLLIFFWNFLNYFWETFNKMFVFVALLALER